MQEKLESPSYFPIKIRIEKTGEVKIIQTPEDLPSGISMRIIEVRVSQRISM